jgi:hypothetical protein
MGTEFRIKINVISLVFINIRIIVALNSTEITIIGFSHGQQLFSAEFFFLTQLLNI